LCIGTFGERKNQELLVDALATDLLRETVAVFIGDGDEGPIRTRALVRGVANRVIVLGPRPAASRYLQLADVLVLPSRNEGLPVAVIEALRASVPVVGTNIPEIVEVLGAELADCVCPPDDARRLGATIRAVFDRPDKSLLRARLRTRFDSCYSESAMLAEYQRVYDSKTAALDVV
jgi:glycosyltransferase involved in cell wall biosynthesis